MEKAFHVQLISYSNLLKGERISFKEDAKCLHVGKLGANSGYVIFVSCRTLDTPHMLKKTLPFLKATKSAFRLIKNQHLQYRLNSGDFGEDEAGKVLSIFSKSTDEFISLAIKICSLTEDFKGPVVIESQRIGKVVFVQEAKGSVNALKLSVPTLKNFPLPVPKAYLPKKKRNSLMGKFYLPVQLIRSSPKGNIYKAINLKKLAFNWCLVKQGNPVALDDHFDRDMRDRLLWQKEVIGRLEPEVCTPQVLDYFEKNDSSYLILNYAEGDSYGHTFREALAGIEWMSLAIDVRQKFLGYYLKILDLISAIHEKCFVHRDITDSNFLIMTDESLCIIDFELSYSLEEHRPNPPFLLGTFGYAAPEQLEYAVPDFKEDIYSLGALLAFTISGRQPHEFLDTTTQNIRAKMSRLSGSGELGLVTVKCLSPRRKDRPEIDEIRRVITNYLENIIPKSYEKVAMAL